MNIFKYSWDRVPNCLLETAQFALPQHPRQLWVFSGKKSFLIWKKFSLNNLTNTCEWYARGQGYQCSFQLKQRLGLFPLELCGVVRKNLGSEACSLPTAPGPSGSGFTVLAPRFPICKVGRIKHCCHLWPLGLWAAWVHDATNTVMWGLELYKHLHGPAKGSVGIQRVKNVKSSSGIPYPVVRTQDGFTVAARVQSLVAKLSSCKLHGTAKKKWKAPKTLWHLVLVNFGYYYGWRVEIWVIFNFSICFPLFSMFSVVDVLFLSIDRYICVLYIICLHIIILHVLYCT